MVERPVKSSGGYWRLLLAVALSATVMYLVVDPAEAASPATLQAESMSLSPIKSGRIVSEETASSGKALLMGYNGTVSGSFTGSFDRLIIRMRGDQCRGGPRAVVRVDGKVAMTRTVDSRSWTNYAVDTEVANGSHSLEITFNNDYYRRYPGCDRNLYLDEVSFATLADTPSDPAPTGFVTRSGTNFAVDGKPFRFVGANVYNAAGDPRIYECGPYMDNPDEQLDEWFSRLKSDSGSRVVRFWAFQRYTNGGTDWRALDRVLRLANKHGLKVIPVLENQGSYQDPQDQACSSGGYRYDTWYAGSYLRSYGDYPISYKAYVKRVVERYKDDPAVAAWMLMNEAESQTIDGSEKPDALYGFASDMSAYVKSIDKNHLVTLGVMGGPQAGVRGASYERLHSIPTIDFLEYHDYGANDEAMPGSPLKFMTPVNVEIYTQDGDNPQTQENDIEWKGGGFSGTEGRKWKTIEWVVPAGDVPFHKIGLNMYADTGEYGPYEGDIYVDQVEVGSKVYNFEDSTTEGFRSTAKISSMSNSTSVVYSGSHSLKLRVSFVDVGAQLYVPAPPEAVPGATIRARVYVDTAGSADHSDTLARAMYVSKKLNKPILVGEAGMWTCSAPPGNRLETVETRARKFDAKMNAFFGDGGAGYLIWAWDPASSCTTDFTTDDPLNAVLKKYVADL